MELDGPTVTLKDEIGRELLCYVELSVDIKDETYALLNPVDDPVDIFSWVSEADASDDEEVLMPIDEAELNEVFATAQAVLAEQNLKLKRSAMSLTVEGDLPNVDEENILTLEIEDDVNPDQQETYQLLASFFHEEVEYAVYTPIDPVLFVVRMQGREPQLLSPEEFQSIQADLQPYLEDHLFEGMD